MKKIFIFVFFILIFFVLTSCVDPNADPNEEKVSWKSGFYTNVVDVKNLGLRLGLRTDGYYQIIQMNDDLSNLSNKNVLIFPSHYKGIPIMGLGTADDRTWFSPEPPTYTNDYCSMHGIYEYSFYMTHQTRESDVKIDTFYVCNHHGTDNVYTIYVNSSDVYSRDSFKKYVYMSDINRKQNPTIPECDHNIDKLYFHPYVYEFLDVFPLFYRINEEKFKSLLNLELKMVATKEFQEFILNNILEFKINELGIEEEYLYDVEYLLQGKFDYFYYCYVDVVLKKWFIEPNIYFYNNTSETDEDIYWIDHNDNGETLFTPYEPYNEGKTFLGWYTEKECINEWNFDTKIKLGENEVLNLYAKWG